MKLGVILSVVLFSCCVFAKEKQVLRYGVNSNYAMPLLGVTRLPQGQVLQEGVLKDLGEALAKELKREPQFILLPKIRVAENLKQGSIDVLCHLNEVWQPAIKNDVYWSDDLYESRNLIVHIDSKPIKSISDLYGARVGTVLNFIYQNLDPYFAKKQILREDAPTNESNIQKILKGRIDYLVMSNLEFDFYKRIYPTLDAVDLSMDSVQTKCALSKKSSISPESFEKAIQTIQRNGVLRKILKSYQ
ncbi:substrate-binding periplasmic protein [Bdellovibrio bacteriovorus]|uniref:substrate-binding periplasmic protein n=1 Tax=Bdellovibrio bacteriovorus TaxID=959 RepID=UPI0035A6F931